MRVKAVSFIMLLALCVSLMLVAALPTNTPIIAAPWTSMPSSATETLLGVWGSSSSDVFAVGYDLDGYGTILHYDKSYTAYYQVLCGHGSEMRLNEM